MLIEVTEEVTKGHHTVNLVCCVYGEVNYNTTGDKTQ